MPARSSSGRSSRQRLGSERALSAGSAGARSLLRRRHQRRHASCFAPRSSEAGTTTRSRARRTRVSRGRRSGFASGSPRASSTLRRLLGWRERAGRRDLHGRSARLAERVREAILGRKSASATPRRRWPCSPRASAFGSRGSRPSRWRWSTSGTTTSTARRATFRALLARARGARRRELDPYLSVMLSQIECVRRDGLRRRRNDAEERGRARAAGGSGDVGRVPAGCCGVGACTWRRRAGGLGGRRTRARARRANERRSGVVLRNLGAGAPGAVARRRRGGRCEIERPRRIHRASRAERAGRHVVRWRRRPRRSSSLRGPSSAETARLVRGRTHSDWDASQPRRRRFAAAVALRPAAGDLARRDDGVGGRAGAACGNAAATREGPDVARARRGPTAGRSSGARRGKRSSGPAASFEASGARLWGGARRRQSSRASAAERLRPAS